MKVSFSEFVESITAGDSDRLIPLQENMVGKRELIESFREVSKRILSLKNYNESLVNSYSENIGKLKDTIYIKPSYLECPKCNNCSSGNIDEGEEACSVCLGSGKIRISYRERRQREKLSEIMKEDFRAMERKTYL